MSLETRVRDALAPWLDARAWKVGFSGGLDSTVLLHLLSEMRRQGTVPPLSAIHVHHGLQPAADAWPSHCRQICAQLKVPLEVLPVDVAPGDSLESAAREARLAAFETALEPGEALMLAHHREDQAETVLFRLLRGSGVRGLTGIPEARRLGEGHLVRPLLGIARSELEAYARAHGLQWIEDPSNADTGMARNYLRRRVMPLLTERWPGAPASLSRAASHLREAEVLLGELAEADLSAARAASTWPWLTVPSLALQPLSQLSEARQRNVMRHWLRPFTELPDREHWAGWIALRDAAGKAAPIWRLKRGELHRSGGRLWWLSGEWLEAFAAAPVSWNSPHSILPLPGNGSLSLEGQPVAETLNVRYRTGGERMAIAGRGHRDLKRLLNESMLPVFLRPRIPLVFQGDELIAVANLPGLSVLSAQGTRFLWTPPDATRV